MDYGLVVCFLALATLRIFDLLSNRVCFFVGDGCVAWEQAFKTLDINLVCLWLRLFCLARLRRATACQSFMFMFIFMIITQDVGNSLPPIVSTCPLSCCRYWYTYTPTCMIHQHYENYTNQRHRDRAARHVHLQGERRSSRRGEDPLLPGPRGRVHLCLAGSPAETRNPWRWWDGDGDGDGR